MNLIKTLLCAGSLLSLLCVQADNMILNAPFRTAESVEKQYAWQAEKEFSQANGGSLKLTVPARVNTAGITFNFPAARIAGKRLHFSVMLKGENVAPAQEEWNGGKFQLTLQTPAGTTWPSARVKRGSFAWEKLEFSVEVPFDAQSASLTLGFQDSFGTLYVQDLKVVATDTFFNLRPAANMGLADPVAGDGKGGWSDQGPDNDASGFRWKSPARFANVPFSLRTPSAAEPETILVMKSSNFPNGREHVTIPAPEKSEGSYLYLLHTLCHARPGQAGTLVVKKADGSEQSFPVVTGQDVADWWVPKRLPNAYPAATWSIPSGETVGVYLSRFALGGSSAVTAIEFRSEPGTGNVWIILGATLSGENYPLPGSATHTLATSDRWKALPSHRPGVIAGSALDRSALTPVPTELPRVIVTDKGQLAFENAPEQPVRFLAAADSYTTFTWSRDRNKAEEYTRQLRMQGYNMSRFHYLDHILVGTDGKALVFRPDALEAFDQFIYYLKQNGLYLNLDLMCSNFGFTPGDPWTWNEKNPSFKYEIYFDPAVRENWKRGVEQLLTRINPLTGTRLADDPVLAMVNGFNEQEFAFFSAPKKPELMLPYWHTFLQERYPEIARYREAWGSDATDWDAVPLFSPADKDDRGVKGRDVALFLQKTEGEMYQWYADTLREIGYKGPVCNYDMGLSLRYITLRKTQPMVMAHAYHAHPSYGKVMTINQASSIGSSASLFRTLNGSRLAGKPFLVTEYGAVFWNRYRYEQAFAAAAYAAFQDYSALTVHSQPVNISAEKAIQPFACMNDPVIRASEYLTAYLFRRGDVAPAASFIRFNLSEQEIFDNGTFNDGMHGGQSRLGLVVGTSAAVDSAAPLRSGELAISGSGGSSIITRPGYSAVIESDGQPFDIDAVVRELKKQKLLSAKNRTAGSNELFESAGEELFLDARNNFMTVDTPKLQGVCMEAGKTAELSGFSVSVLSTRGNVAAVSVDDLPLAESRRIVLVYATNALNSGMVFEDEEMRSLLNNGTTPVLVETGSFDFRLSHSRAAKLRLYALREDGSRRFEIPLTREAGKVSARIDTAGQPEGPSVYYELTEN